MLMLLFTFCMTDLVPSPEDRIIFGLFFNGSITLNLGIHLFFLFADVFAKLFGLIKRKCSETDMEDDDTTGQETQKWVELQDLNPLVFTPAFNSGTSANTFGFYEQDPKSLLEFDLSEIKEVIEEDEDES